MIIFFENGRLGNQLFQYCAMRKFRPEGQILAIGMYELKNGFSGIDIVPAAGIWKVIEKIIGWIGKNRIEFAATKLRIFAIVEEEKTAIGIQFKFRAGLFGKLIYFKAGFYQSEAMIDENIAGKIAINTTIKEYAANFFKRMPGESKNRYFVHIRRGDYVNWPSKQAPAVVPLSWYQKQMSSIRNFNSEAIFIVVSDDRPYVEEFFSQEDDVVIACYDLIEDFSIMTSCLGGGVMSASTLSWWVSHFIRSENPDARFIAPNYWAGCRVKKWHPEFIRTSWIEYDEVF